MSLNHNLTQEGRAPTHMEVSNFLLVIDCSYVLFNPIKHVGSVVVTVSL